MGLETFLFQKKAWGRHSDCLLCENLSSSIHGRFVTFWKLIRGHAVTPRWLDDAKEFIQSGWSKHRDSCSLAHVIPTAVAGRFESRVSRKLFGG